MQGLSVGAEVFGITEGVGETFLNDLCFLSVLSFIAYIFAKERISACRTLATKLLHEKELKYWTIGMSTWQILCRQNDSKL